jgi:nucleotide-binding universal stress UspA family protein
MFGTILVATDGSGTATRAVDLAARIARATGAKLHAISVYGEPSNGGVLVPEQTSGIDVARGLLDDVRKHHGDEVALETEAHPGDPADVILAVAQERGVDLIVAGDRGMSSPRHVLGNIPNALSHHAPCHLLLAHTDDGSVNDVTVTKVVLATDGSATATEAVRVGVALADAMDAQALLVTVAEAAEGAEILDRTRKEIGRDLDGRVVQGSVTDAIIDTAASIGADLIVTGSRGMQGARRLLGSVPNSVSHNATCSLLIAKTV